VREAGVAIDHALQLVVARALRGSCGAWQRRRQQEHHADARTGLGSSLGMAYPHADAAAGAGL
jgi:hypothetical protein